MSELKFEVGKHYRTLDGGKRLCVWVFSDGYGLFVDENRDFFHCRDETGSDSPEESPNDIVSEWREPRQ